MSYLRDGRAPIPKNERISATMSRIRAKNTQPELLARKHLRELGYRGYRLHYKRAAGKPDIAFVGRRVAIFIHGCFWHGCPHCRPRTPKSNATFWTTKVATNQVRDKRKVLALRREGWKVFTVWECKMKRSPEKAMASAVRALAG